jgi:predicted CXXCH cytochrome family protein
MDGRNIEKSGPRTALLVGIGVLGVLLAAAGILYSWMPANIQQPLLFSHQLHVEDSGLECTDCHLYAESGERATIPNIEVCSDCHDVASTESENELKLVEYVETGEKIPWRKVYRVPNHVYFSHRRHTAVSGIECEECHGPIATQTQSIRRAQPRITMDRCMQCHEETDTTNDCISCHR